MQNWLPLTTIAIILIYGTRLKSTIFPKYWQKISIVAEEFKHNDQLYVVLGEIATHLFFVTLQGIILIIICPQVCNPIILFPHCHSKSTIHAYVACCIRRPHQQHRNPRPTIGPESNEWFCKKKNNTRIIFCVFALYVLLVVALAIIPGECLVSK